VVEIEHEAAEGEPEPQKTRDISAVLAANKDCVGWLFIDGTIINYPVMHTPYSAEKYLHANFEGNYSYSGTPFLDARCNKDSTNTILYGHNMKNGTMFNQLRWYRTREHLEKYPFIEYQTAEGLRKFRVFAVALIAANDKWYSFIEADSEEAYNNRLQYLKSIQYFNSGITPTYPQKLITLSTCSGEGRYIVVGYETDE
jgi:sortase B